MNCNIDYDTGATLTGVCDPTQYETPYQGTGYDPNWISCSIMQEGHIYCFHPNQGHGNQAIESKEQIKLPSVLPTAGADINPLSKYSFIIGTLIIITSLLLARKMRK